MASSGVTRRRVTGPNTGSGLTQQPNKDLEMNRERKASVAGPQQLPTDVARTSAPEVFALRYHVNTVVMPTLTC